MCSASAGSRLSFQVFKVEKAGCRRGRLRHWQEITTELGSLHWHASAGGSFPADKLYNDVMIGRTSSRLGIAAGPPARDPPAGPRSLRVKTGNLDRIDSDSEIEDVHATFKLRHGTKESSSKNVTFANRPSPSRMPHGNFPGKFRVRLDGLDRDSEDNGGLLRVSAFIVPAESRDAARRAWETQAVTVTVPDCRAARPGRPGSRSRCLWPGGCMPESESAGCTPGPAAAIKQV
jgi:hypothetical protein